MNSLLGGTIGAVIGGIIGAAIWAGIAYAGRHYDDFSGIDSGIHCQGKGVEPVGRRLVTEAHRDDVHTRPTKLPGNRD